MYFFWVDCEMTGLNTENDFILELAFIVTDKNMKELVSLEYIFHQPLIVLESMNEWCLINHKKSGLFERSLVSNIKYEDAEKKIMNILSKYTIKKETYLAGNSIYKDLEFLKKFFPKIVEWMHYRLFDVSTLKLFWHMLDKKPFIKEKNHRAIEDIKESIAEYQYYKNLFK